MKNNYFYKSLFTFLIFLFFFNTVNAQNCTVNADINQEICKNETMQLQGGENGLIDVHAVWSQVGGPSVNIVDPVDLNSNVLGYTANQTYTFRITATCQDGKTVYDEVDFTVYPITEASAGTDIESCPTTLTLSANTASGTGETGNWTIVSNGAGVSGLTASSPSSTISLSTSDAGISTLRWTITGPNSCSSSDDVRITNYGGVSPVSAGSDQNLSQCYTATQSANLSGSFGGANYGGQQGTWTMVSGPNYANIANIHDNTTTASGLIEGTYVFRWEVSGPCVNGSDEVTIIVPAATQDVTNVADFPNQSYCYAETDVVLEGTAPEFANEVGYWTQITSHSATIANPSSATTTVNGLNGTSTYIFRYVIENTATGCTSGTDDIVIYYRDKPTIDASIIEPNLPCGTSTASITVTPHTSGSRSRYSIISGPYTTGEINAPNPTDITFTQSGTYNIQFVSYVAASTGMSVYGCTSDFDYLTITVSDSPLASNAGTDQILGCNVITTELEGNTPSIGSGYWTQVSGPPSVANATIDDVTDPHSRISGLEVGIYTFRWLINAGNNCPPTQDDVDVIVSKTTASSAAGDAQSVCYSTSVILSGNSLKSNETGEWTVSPPAGISFADANNPSTAVTGMAASTPYTFTWAVTNGCGTVSDDVVITTTNVQGPSLSDAGIDKCENGSTTVDIGMTGNDPSIGIGQWTVLSGPNSPTIVNPTLFNTQVEGLIEGDYRIEWSINVPTCNATKDTLTVTVNEDNTTVSVAGGDQSICGDEATMSANGVATGELGTWVQVSGNSGYTISSVNSPNALFSNLLPGRYEFQWLIEQGICPSTTDNIVFTISETPSSSVTSSSFAVCSEGVDATISANNPDSGTGLWSVTEGPNSPDIASFTSPTTTVSNLNSGKYTFRWTISSGPECAAEISTSDISVSVAIPAVANASETELCNVTDVLLEGTPETQGTWTCTNSGIPTITNGSFHTAYVKDLALGVSYNFRYTIDAIYDCIATNADVTVTTSGRGDDPTAGDDQDLCTVGNNYTVTMDANDPGTGNGSWSQVGNTPSAATIDDNTLFNSDITNLTDEGVYLFEWNVDYQNCGVYKDVVRINVYDEPSDAEAGDNQINACELSAQLHGNTPTIGIGTWTLISATPTTTATITINNPNTAETYISNPSHIGTYRFMWTITNGSCVEKTDIVDITFTDDPPSTPDADDDRNLCDVTSITMSGNDPTVGTGTWSQISGPNSSTIVNPNDYDTDITGMIAGIYEFRWAIQNGGCTLNDEMTVINSPTPSDPVVGSTQNLCRYESPVLTAENPTYGTGQWSVVSGTPTPTLLTPDNTTTNVTGTDLGTYIFRWTVSSGACADKFDDVDVHIADFPASNLSVTDDEICEGADGDISILSSENTVTYRIYDGTTLLDTQTGDGNALDFIISNAILSVGNNYYSYTATNTSNCTIDFDSQSLIRVNANPDIPLPVSDDVVCEGDNATVTISNSGNGVNYEAFNGTTSVGTGSGNGGDLDISFPTDGTWVGVSSVTITATSNGTGCVSNLSDQSNITVNTNPLDDKSVDGNTVCVGSDGTVTIANSETGVDYEAFIGVASVGTGSGNGNDLDINVGTADIPIVNTYIIDIVATSTTAPTNCSVPLVDDGTITVINSPLTNQTVSGNTVCYGVNAIVTVNTTENGVIYDVYFGAILIGSGVGTGSSIDITCATTSLSTGSNVITLTATNAGCSLPLDNSTTININENPDATLDVTDFTVCDGNDGQITILSSETSIVYEAFINSSSVWTGTGTGTNLDVTIASDELLIGINNVEIVADNGACSVPLSDIGIIIINENPVANLLVEGSTNCSTDDATVTIESSENNISYELFLETVSLATGIGNLSDLEITVNSDLLETGENTIRIIATNTSTSCTSELDNEAIVTIEVCEIIVYDGFSPNGDGINETFVIDGLDKRPNHSVTIFNRWGNKVYEASPYLSDWDGTNMFGVSIGSDKLPVGTYFYIIEPGNGEKVKKGYIYLDY